MPNKNSQGKQQKAADKSKLPNKGKTEEKSKKIKMAGISGMPQFQVQEADKLQMFLNTVNMVNPITGKPTPNKTVFDTVLKDYEDWFEPVTSDELINAYYGLLFPIGKISDGADDIKKRFNKLLEVRDQAHLLEFFKDVIKGNWLVKNNKLDSNSYTKLTNALDTINPKDYVVPTSMETLDLNSSLCYLNKLLHKLNPTEFGSDLMPKECQAELPPTYSMIEAQTAPSVKQNNTMTHISYNSYNSRNNMRLHMNNKKTKTPVSKTQEKHSKKGSAAKHSKKGSARNPAHQKLDEEMEEGEEVKPVEPVEPTDKTGNEFRLDRYVKKHKKNIKSQKHEDVLNNLNILIRVVKNNANKKVIINNLFMNYGHLLEDANLIKEYSDKHQNLVQVIEDAKGLYHIYKNSLAKPSSVQASASKRGAIVVTETPKPVNDAPKTIEDAAKAIANSYESGSESNNDMKVFRRPVYIRKNSTMNEDKKKTRKASLKKK
jgi:hypothetical protein